MICQNMNLKQLNKFRVPVLAKEYFSFEATQELREFLRSRSECNVPILVLGGGSNILFTGDFNGLVIHPINDQIRVKESSKAHVIVEAFAGRNWDSFVQHCVKNGWQGVENLTLIPGNVGAAPVQNIGAYGTEASDTVVAVHCLNLSTNEVESFRRDECRFSYRSSLFKERKDLLVLSVEFKLKKCNWLGILPRVRRDDALISDIGKFLKVFATVIRSIRFGPSTMFKPKVDFAYVRDFVSSPVIPIQIKRLIVRIIRERTMPNPDTIGNVGCFFKSSVVNGAEAERVKALCPEVTLYPQGDMVKVSVGDLMKATGWAGKRVGDVLIDKSRPLILLNCGNATGKEILEVAEKIEWDIHAKYAINIEPEVVII